MSREFESRLGPVPTGFHGLARWFIRLFVSHLASWLASQVVS